ncbi:MAG TPA: hypothetical protein VNH11_34390 [Pirellulales bacterium]|nr:hypothetical protein [Pirellulales bacterium]
MIALSKRLWVISFVAVLASASQAFSGDVGPPPRTGVGEKSLANWVDADLGLCLEIDNLAEHWEQFIDSPMHQRLRRFPPVADALERHREGLAQLGAEIRRRTGAAPREIGQKLLGKKVLFAIRPPENPAKQKPSALLLVDSADEQFMRRTLDNLVAARRQAGRWKGKHTLTVAGGPVSVDVVLPDDDQSEFFIASVGSMAAVSTSESLLRSVLDRHATKDGLSSLAASPAYRAARERLATQCVARLWINPRAWEAILAADLGRKPPDSEEARTQAALFAVWRATQYVAAGVQLAPQLRIELASQWIAESLPDAARDVVSSVAGPSQFIDKIPAKSLLAVAGHIDIGRLTRSAVARQWQAAAKSSMSETNKHHERILLWALSAGLGPDWGLWVSGGAESLATLSQSKSVSQSKSLPFDIVAGIETRPVEPGGGRLALAENIEPLLHALLSATVEAANRESGKHIASLKSTERDGRTTTSVSGMVPGRPQQEFAYGVDQRHWFWLGTSSTAIEQAGAGDAGNSLWTQLASQQHWASAGTPNALVYVNLAGWRKLASLGRPAFEFLWDGRQKDEKKKDEQFQSWVTWTQLADRLLFVCHMDQSSMHLALGLE